MLILISLLFCSIVTTNCDGNKKNVLVKFKNDVDKVGKDFENLVFDIVTKIVDDISAYQVNGDYFTSDEDTSTENKSTQHSVSKKILEDTLENTTQEYITENSMSTPIVAKILTLKERRIRRSTNETEAPFTKSKHNSTEINGTQVCPKKSLEEQTLELQHIEDLKDEMQKLHDLVILLRDQQKLISLLDKNTQTVDGDISTRFDTKDLLKLLDYINSRDIRDRRDRFRSDKLPSDSVERRTTYEELANIKSNLKETIQTLNKTKEFLAVERKKEILLEKEVSDQKMDLDFLKMMVRKLYKNHMSFPEYTADGDILGTAIHLPKTLPIHNPLQAIGIKNNVKAITNKAKTSGELVHEKLKQENTLGARSGEMSDLEKLLHRLSNPKRSEIESRMFELQEEINKKKKEEDLIKFLKKYLEQRKELHTGASSRTDPEIIKKLQVALELLDGPKRRAGDSDIELELHKLQDAIDNLKPKDELDLDNDIATDEQSESDLKRFETIFNKLFDQKGKAEEDEAKQFQATLNKMLGRDGKKEEDQTKQFQMALDKMINQGRKNEVKNSADVKENSLLLKEVMELRRQLASMEKPNFRGGNLYSGDGASSYGPEVPSPFGTKPYRTEFPSGANFVPNYPPQYSNSRYQSPMSQILNNGDTPAEPNNQHYTNYLPPYDRQPSKYNNQNFMRAYSYYKSAPKRYQKYDGGLNQNNYQNPPASRPFESLNHNGFQSSFQQNPYYQTHLEGPSASGQVYVEPPFPNSLYHSKDLTGPTAPYSYNPNMNPDFLEPPNQHNTDVDTYQKQFNTDSATAFAKHQQPYTQINTNNNHNIFDQEDRNQFFPGRQQNIYSKSPAESTYSSQSTTGHSQDQSGVYPQKTSDGVDYAYRKAEDLKGEIYNLQGVIDGLNKPNYVQTPQDKETVTNLENQISELKGVMNTLVPDQTPSVYLSNTPDTTPNQSNLPDQQANYPDKQKSRRSTDKSDSQLYDQMVSGLKQLIFKNENEIEGRSNYDDIQKRINDLKYQLEGRIHSSKQDQRNFNQVQSKPPYYYQNQKFNNAPQTNKFDIFKSKKNDIFTSIVLKILDKVLAATPAVLEKLFGHGLTELSNFEDYSTYGDNYNYDMDHQGLNDVQKLFKSLGFFGYGPLVILKLIDGFATFVKILKKNDFFKNFLMPALILLLVAGGVLFLIWWLQPNVESSKLNLDNPRPDPGGYYGSNNNKYHVPYSNYNYHGSGYGNNDNNHGYGGSYNPYSVYSKSYFEDGKRRSNFL